jgi:hypothetical protein
MDRRRSLAGRLSRFSILIFSWTRGGGEGYSRSSQDTFTKWKVSDDGHPGLSCGIDQSILLVVDKPGRLLDLKGINVGI